MPSEHRCWAPIIISDVQALLHDCYGADSIHCRTLSYCKCGKLNKISWSLTGLCSNASLKLSVATIVIAAETSCADCQPRCMQGLGLGQEALSILRGFGLAEELDGISLPLPTEVNTAVCPSGKSRVLQRDDNYNHRRQVLQYCFRPVTPTCSCSCMSHIAGCAICNMSRLRQSFLGDFTALSQNCICTSALIGRISARPYKELCIMVLNKSFPCAACTGVICTRCCCLPCHRALCASRTLSPQGRSCQAPRRCL